MLNQACFATGFAPDGGLDKNGLRKMAEALTEQQCKDLAFKVMSRVQVVVICHSNDGDNKLALLEEWNKETKPTRSIIEECLRESEIPPEKIQGLLDVITARPAEQGLFPTFELCVAMSQTNYADG